MRPKRIQSKIFSLFPVKFKKIEFSAPLSCIYGSLEVEGKPSKWGCQAPWPPFSAGPDYTCRITPKRVTSLRCPFPQSSATCVDVEAMANRLQHYVRFDRLGIRTIDLP